MGNSIVALAAFTSAPFAEYEKYGAQKRSADDEINAINLQAQEQQLAYEQKSISNLDLVKKTLDTQEAMMTTRGVSMNSSSFNAIQRNTLNIGNKTNENLDIEKSFMDLNIENEKRNVKDKLQADLFGDISDLSSQIMKVGESMPMSG